MSTYQNFDLLIERTSDGYRARVLDAPWGKGKVRDFKLPFSPAQLKAFFWRAGHNRHLALVPEPATQDEPMTPRFFGEHLYRAVFQEQLENALAFSYREAKGNQAGLRLRLC
ncbi:MAG: hypothetical protein DCC55_15510, partial [Chloroflexi bacterium]